MSLPAAMLGSKPTFWRQQQPVATGDPVDCWVASRIDSTSAVFPDLSSLSKIQR